MVQLEPAWCLRYAPDTNLAITGSGTTSQSAVLGVKSEKPLEAGRSLGLPPGGSPDSPSQLRVCALLFPFQALQIGHAPKLSEIGGHEGRPKSESMGRDEHVERTDDDASLLQINAQVTVVARGL